MVEDKSVEEEIVESEEIEDKEEDIADALERELSSLRGEDEQTAETPVAEEGGKTEGDNEGAEEDSGPVSEDDEEAWLASQSERSQERYRQLAERAKRAEEEAESVRQSGEELYKIMSESGVTPQDLTNYFEYYKSLNNGQLEQAAQWWNNLEQTHSRFTGSKVGNTDPLDNHPDLKQKVEGFDMSEDAARELASLRDYSERMKVREQHMAEMGQQTAEQQRQQQEVAHYASSAAMELDKWSAEMKAKDPQFEAKEALLLERAQEQFPNMHPAYWPEFVAREYAYLTKAIPEAATKSPAPNPIRPGASGKSVSTEPKNISDALDNALREMRS